MGGSKRMFRGFSWEELEPTVPQHHFREVRVDQNCTQRDLSAVRRT
jgi:hypothetical protein